MKTYSEQDRELYLEVSGSWDTLKGYPRNPDTRWRMLAKAFGIDPNPSTRNWLMTLAYCKTGESHHEIGKAFGVSRSYANKIIRKTMAKKEKELFKAVKTYWTTQRHLEVAKEFGLESTKTTGRNALIREIKAKTDASPRDIAKAYGISQARVSAILALEPLTGPSGEIYNKTGEKHYDTL